MLFSQRKGFKPVKTILQIESIDNDLMNRLWNITLELFFYKFDDQKPYTLPQTDRGEICRLIWKDFFNYPVDTAPKYKGSIIIYSDGFIAILREWFYEKAYWFEIFDFIEFLCRLEIDYIMSGASNVQQKFIIECNAALKKEVAGYRIINNTITQITSDEEIQAIEEATFQNGKLKLVSLHLKTALDLLADKKNPDYRNSIKESISAVESIAKIISGNPKDSLAGALDKIRAKIKIHESLERAFKQIYGYTSDADGIRHALKEGSDCDFEDAKYMLVSCSAFINYLISKSEKACIVFE